MALTDPYVSTAELRAYLRIGDHVDDGRLSDAARAASRGVDKFCGRCFNDAGVASERVFTELITRHLVRVDDFHTTTGLAVTVSGTAWVAADYRLEPVNGVVDGEPGWPYYRIRAMRSGLLHSPVTITARWGWAQLPEPVHQACLMLAAEIFKAADAPFGVAGFDQFGAIRVRDNPKAARMLAPYQRDPVLVG